METFVSIQSLLPGFSETSGSILLVMHKVNRDEAQLLTDRVQSAGAVRLRC